MHTTRTFLCPQCKKSTIWQGNAYRPFCSERCKLLDLGAWASERYRIAGDEHTKNHSSNDNDR